MRKYRGLTKEGKWVYGWYVLSNEKHYIIDCYGVTGTALVLADTISDLPGYHEVIPETVGQSTGLKDKNGREIYEGDIVRTKYEKLPPLSIDWRDGGFYYSPAKKDEEGLIYCVCEFTTSEDEVIGNIHENPDFMETKP